MKFHLGTILCWDLGFQRDGLLVILFFTMIFTKMVRFFIEKYTSENIENILSEFIFKHGTENCTMNFAQFSIKSHDKR